MEGRSGNGSGHCKIRKRGCSSSSSSSLVRRYRLKRAILVGKRTGSSTPTPTWKLGSKSPALVVPNSSNYPTGPMESKEVPVSARKLGATLWEINEVPSPVKDVALDDKKGMRRREKHGKFSHSESLMMPPRVSDPTYSPLPEGMDRPEGGKHRRRASAVSQKLQLADYVGGQEDSIANANVVEIESHSCSKNHTEGLIDMRTRLKDLGNSLTTSKELLKVLYRVGGLGKQQPSTISLVSALRAELDQARAHVEELIHESRARQSEIEFLTRHFNEEKAVWKAKERDRVRNAIAHVAEELEVERKLRRQTERLNKKLGNELLETKANLSKAVKELESERRAKEILEQVCDELAQGIGEDRAEVEQLKRESAKVLEEVEQEREMLQLADVLREERVQMKLSEAKYHFEEKNAAVERLKSELENYLRTKVGQEEDNEDSPKSERSKKLEALLTGSYGISNRFELDHQNGEVNREVEESEGDDSADSDLHSIELNMDNNTRSYKWSFGEGLEALDPTKRDSVDKELPFNGRRSLSEKIQWASISLKKGTSNGVELGPNSCENLNGFDRGRLVEFVSHAQAKNEEDQSKRHRTTKGIRDSKVPGFGIASLQPVTSPIRKWGPVPDPVSDIRESSPTINPRAEAARISSERGNEPVNIET
ncbi:uncharacterized protein LOC116210734 [Punica granatum]|uniref:Uncharacterized protein n=2 Tax=Punica granatum TaxID=22663 RepID=A0A218W9X7_PUNGR|nr:uncharacterized protein LOC116210734 [Punica granatum]OWM69021.1 hypothetical protein CDL15_Pgr025208 [Punica granatum]PKI73388.1 hypothetical protein CRG98_006326 [Punica granatum]